MSKASVIYPVRINGNTYGDEAALAKRCAFMLNDKQLEAWESIIWQRISDWINPELTTLEIFSSGSTGTPKAISHKKQFIQSSAELSMEALDIAPGGHSFLAIPAKHVGGMMLIIRSLIHGLALWYTAPHIRINLNTAEKISLCSITPLQALALLESEDSSNLFFNQVEIILIGGAVISPAINQWLQSISSLCYESYGMTETISHIALRKINGPDRQDFFTALPGVSLMQEADQSLSIHAPSIGVEHLHTNDIVEWLGDGRFRFLGRKDNVINSGGLKIYPEALELELSSSIFSPFAICGIPSEKYGEEVVLVLEGNPDFLQLEAVESIITALKRPDRPRSVLVVDSFPRTENGKILRKQLREMLLQQIR
jgi:O-succinylbenzoic acid--CoA ligase